MIARFLAAHGFLETSLLVSLLIAIFLPLRPLLRRAVGSQWLCLLWLAILLRLLLPWPMESRVGLIRHFTQSTVFPAKTAGPVQVNISFAKETEKSPAIQPVAPAENMASSGYHWNLPLLLWASGFLLGIGLLVFRGIQTRVLAAKTFPATDERLLAAFAAIPAQWRRNVELRETTAVHVPTLAGIFRPQIWMPQAWTPQFTGEELRNVLLHELGHARRRDLLVQWVFAFAQCIHWFNPFVWLAARAARLDREMACDAWVLVRNDADCVVYGSTLLKTALSLRSLHGVSPAVVTMASSHGSLRSRIAGIGSFRTSPAWHGVASIICMLAVLAALTTSRAASGEKEFPAITPTVTPVVEKPEPTPAATPAEPAPPSDTLETHIEIESKFVEINENTWKELAGKNEDLKRFSEKLPMLGNESKPLNTMADEATGAQDKEGLISSKLSLMEVLPHQKTESLMKFLNDAQGIDFMSAPNVTTKPGMTATVEIVREFRYPTEFEADKFTSTGYTPTAFEMKKLGVVLTALPKFEKDDFIDLKLTAEVVSFLGFLTEKDGRKSLMRDKAPGRFDKPVFSSSKIETDISSLQDMTVLMGGVRVEEQAITDGQKAVRSVLLMFITAKKAVPVPGEASPAGPSGMAKATPPEVQNLKYKKGIPYGIPTRDKPGFVLSPYAPEAGMVDLRGFPPDTEVKDPYSGKIFLTP